MYICVSLNEPHKAGRYTFMYHQGEVIGTATHSLDLPSAKLKQLSIPLVDKSSV